MIDYNNITPIDVFKKYPGYRKKILDLKILALRDDISTINGKKIIIPSFPCEKVENGREGRKKLFFPYFHQVFWFLLMDLKDIDFALSEVKLYMDNGFTFPNGNFIKLDYKTGTQNK